MKDKVSKFIEDKPEYSEILAAAVKVEENPPDGTVGRSGWEWHHVGAHPGRLTKLVSEGIVRVVSRGRRGTRYKLVDREAVARALADRGFEQ